MVAAADEQLLEQLTQRGLILHHQRATLRLVLEHASLPILGRLCLFQSSDPAPRLDIKETHTLSRFKLARYFWNEAVLLGLALGLTCALADVSAAAGASPQVCSSPHGPAAYIKLGSRDLYRFQARPWARLATGAVIRLKPPAGITEAELHSALMCGRVWKKDVSSPLMVPELASISGAPAACTSSTSRRASTEPGAKFSAAWPPSDARRQLASITRRPWGRRPDPPACPARCASPCRRAPPRTRSHPGKRGCGCSPARNARRPSPHRRARHTKRRSS